MSDCKITARINVLATRIAKDNEELTNLQTKLASAELFANVGAGDIVTFKVGRADTRREVSAVVLGRGEVKGVDSVRAVEGEGFAQEIHTVKVAELLSVAKPSGEGDGSSSQVPVGDEADAVLDSLNG